MLTRRDAARQRIYAASMPQNLDDRPTLWHISVSHYSEKARWALDHKRVPHVRRAVSIPGLHIPASMLLTGGASHTYPVLEIDGRAIGDSSEIIAALEERHPERPLYPADPEQRRRALELEDFFDEELGPHIRLLAFHELGKDPERFEAVIARTTPGPMGRLGGAPSPTPAPSPTCASASVARRRPRSLVARSSPRSTVSKPSSARTSTWSATPSASPTSAPPPSSSRWCCPPRARFRQTNRHRRASRASALRSKSAPATAGSRRPSASTGSPPASRLPLSAHPYGR